MPLATFGVVCRAPLAKLESYKAEKEWSIAWFSSFGSHFNYDLHAILDPKVGPPGVDLVPFWTMAVVNVYRKSKRIAVAAEESGGEHQELTRRRN